MFTHSPFPGRALAILVQFEWAGQGETITVYERGPDLGPLGNAPA